jgi:hypothetical protein
MASSVHREPHTTFNKENQPQQPTQPHPAIIVSVIRCALALQTLQKPTKTKIRLHYPFLSFENLGVNPGDVGTRQKLLYEELYDTPQFDLLPTHWLWNREGEWILKIDQQAERGTSIFEEKRGKDASQAVREKLGDDWEDKVETLVTLKTTRFYPSNSDSHWIDFTSWARWEIGYYAVETFAVDCGQVDIPCGSQDPIPSKGIACLFDIFRNSAEVFFGTKLSSKKQEEFLTFARKAAPYITRTPFYGPEVDCYSSCGEEDFESEAED